MHGKLLLYLLALVALSLAAEKRKVHRQAGGQHRITNPESDDTELMKIEASGSRDKKKDKRDQDKVKTLSQQVADGKYGLIQNELFSKPQKRPGVLSYEDNPEVPKDNINNFGGLEENEIWLAENHLLVLRGGKYPPHADKKEHPEPLWPPIDNYKAPLHQVKIPAHPKVPPPFPVQLTDDGPLQILGTNFSRPFNETDQPPAYALPPPDGFVTPDAVFPTFYPNSTNIAPGQTPLPIPVKPSGEYSPGVSFPPSNLNETWPPYLGYLPPGAVILPPPGNQTDLYDDDDPSIYYPPPYSFFYPKDNSSVVPAGPLVPGIILPPPPNFFTLLEETTTPGTVTTARKPPHRQRKPTTTETNTQIYPTTTPLPATVKTKGATSEKPIKVYPVKDQYLTNEIAPKKTTTETPKIITILPARQQDRTYLPPKSNKPLRQQTRKRPENVTILRPVKPVISTSPKIKENEITNKPFRQYGPPPSSNKRVPVTTTHVPLKYYTTSNDIEANSVSQGPDKNIDTSKIRSVKTTIKPTEYYYYEEPESNIVTTPRIPIKQSNYFESTEGYYTQPKPTPTVRQRKPHYIYVTARPYNTQKPRFRFIQQPVNTDTFSIHIAKLQNQIHQYYTTPRTTLRPSPKPVYQYSFQANNYQSQHNNFRPSPPEGNQQNEFRPIPQKYSVEIQQAIQIIPTNEPKYQEIPPPVFYPQSYEQTTERQQENYYTTPRPNYPYEEVTQKAHYVQDVTTSRPISQYSFEVTPNPVYQGFYTKPDEGFFDENTREYFTVFGRKLPSGTTPLPGFRPAISDTYASQDEHSSRFEENQYQDKPISLQSDTLVNYVNPKPAVNPDAELIPAQSPNTRPNYPNVVKYAARPPQRQNDQNSEIIKAIPIEVPPSNTQDSSYVSYQLPGDDGAHFYFLTPQLASRKNQGAGFSIHNLRTEGYVETKIKVIKKDDYTVIFEGESLLDIVI